MGRRSRRAASLLGLLFVVAPLWAQDIPPALQDWKGWVLHDAPEQACPLLNSPMAPTGGRQCVWPGELTLAVDAQGARFSEDVQVDAPAWVALPGGERAWPQSVRVDGQPQPVLAPRQVPAVWLTVGLHHIEGQLAWATRPATLAMPASIGLLALSIDGKPVNRVERQGDRLTLGEAAPAERASDALSVRVYRELSDGLPPTLETRLQLEVAGSAREQLLGPALPAGFVATAVDGDLPARLDADGRLRVQLRPGSWTLTLHARATAPLAAVQWTPPAAPWPAQETWSYADDPALRGTRVAGQGVDAGHAGVPGDWAELPAYRIDAGHGLTVTEVTRGDADGRGDQLRLQREMWLDFDGHGLSVADRVSGTLRHPGRLAVGAPWQLLRASQAGQPLLITQDKTGRGVELRERSLQLDAGLRLPTHGGRLPVAGWQVPLENIEAILHLPPGYHLLGAPGADRSPGSWVAQWTLLDLFVVALIALLAGRALGWPWAALAAAFLALAQHEAGAPRWTLAVALALALLLRALPEGRLRLAARVAALAAFVLAVLWTLPFTATQLQYALHPQLENRGVPVPAHFAMREPAAAGEAAPASMPAPPPPAPPAPPSPSMQAPAIDEATNNPAPESLSAISVSAAGMLGVMDAANQSLDSRNVVQAGDGTPSWRMGETDRLSWSGPVTADQTMRLVIAPAWLVRLLRVLMVALLAALLSRLVPLLVTPWRARWRGGVRGVSTLALLASMMSVAPASHAQQAGLPDQTLLTQLHARLTELPRCTPQCVALANAQLQAQGDTLDVVLQADAGADGGLPLPMGDEGLALVSASLDGHPAAVVRQYDQLLLLRLGRGVHRVALQYRLAGVDTASLRFPLHVGRLAFAGQGWTVSGLDGDRLLGDSLGFSRVHAAGDGTEQPVTQRFPPYVRVTRQLMFGLDWMVQTTVQRIAPAQGGFSLSIPLLPGEHPLGENLPVHDGRLQASFTADEQTVRWQSRLDHAATVTLDAPPLADRAEVWQIDSAPMWHVDAQGVPTSASESGLRFDPRPGETLTLHLSEPEAVAGGSIAFDQVQASLQVGERASELALALQARSTRGGEQALTLPAGAELLQANRDGEPLNLAVRERQLSLPLLPGSHRYELRLRTPEGVGLRTRTPALELHAPAANVALDLQLPHDRWVLWTWGPSAGPAVLYWSQLVVLLLAAWLLARYAPTPLRFGHWLLLGLGFSAFAWSAYALVVVWLIALGLRARGLRVGATLFNLLQVGLALLTLAALLALIGAVPSGLLGLPDMHVAGNGSTAWQLRWFADRSAGALPAAGVVSVPLWVYKLAMLAWALWLANALIGWLRWAFGAWSEGGYWHARAPRTTPPDLPAPTTGESTAHD